MNTLLKVGSNTGTSRLVRFFYSAGCIAFATIAPADTLDTNFETPPMSAKPYTWYHWMDGNVSKDGITKDLQAMKDVGLGGFQLFNIGNHAPDGPIDYMSDEWRDMVKHTIEEADKHGLEVTIHNCDGWANSAGPWIDAAHSMQKVTWNETSVTGGQTIDLQLSRPLANVDYYNEIAVLAIPEAPAMANALRFLNPKITASDESFTPGKIIDDTFETATSLPNPTEEKPQFIDIEFKDPITIRSASMVNGTGPKLAPKAELLASKDGVAYRTLTSLKSHPTSWSTFQSSSANFDAVTARYFRLVFKKPDRAANITISDLRLSGSLCIENWATQAGYVRGNRRLLPPDDRPTTEGTVVKADQIIDLTKFIDGKGRLRWDAPHGQWTVFRIGHTSTGKTNQTPTKEGRGLECDKLSRTAFKLHFDNMLAKIIEDVGPLAGKTLKSALIDSYEVSCNNWTPLMQVEFEKRSGYSIDSWLLAITGRVVESPEQTDRFLYDFRKVIADLFSENYFGYFDELCEENGLQSYSEPYGNGNFDSMAASGKVDIPMTEFWAGSSINKGQRSAVASSARIYGKQIVGAEAFTASPKNGAWRNYPGNMKASGDQVFTEGVNRMIFHRYAHQPWPDQILPGMTMGPWGIHFERTTTWWNMAPAWTEYLARCQYLLQSGLYVADVAVFIGEDAPDIIPTVELPEGYAMDYINPEVLLERMSVRNGRIVLPDGLSYSLLVLPDETRMSVKVLHKIKELVEQGATILGPKPERTWGLQNYENDEGYLREMADSLWGSKTTTSRSAGKGTVLTGLSIAEALETSQIKPDFKHDVKDVPLRYIHRTIDGAEAYFVANGSAKAINPVCEFRVSGKQPELWNPVNGDRKNIEDFDASQDTTTLRLPLHANESAWILFRQSAPPSTRKVTAKTIQEQAIELTGAWNVSFDPRWKAPESIRFDKLSSWTEHENEYIKYYSGTAVYKKTFYAPPLQTEQTIYLDLGVVKEMARVRLNGQDLGIVWTAPFHLEATNAIRAGENDLEIEVVNLWVNRLIGDEQFQDDRSWKPGRNEDLAPDGYPDWMDEYFSTGKRPVPERLTFTNWKHYQKDSPLLPSGLLGPVRIITTQPVR